MLKQTVERSPPGCLIALEESLVDFMDCTGINILGFLFLRRNCALVLNNRQKVWKRKHSEECRVDSPGRFANEEFAEELGHQFLDIQSYLSRRSCYLEREEFSGRN